MGQCWRDFICKFKFYPVLILTLKLTPLDGSQVQLCFTQLHGCCLYLWLNLCSLSINSALLLWSLYRSQWKLDPQGRPLSFLMSLLWTLPTAPGGLLPSSLASNSTVQEGQLSRPLLTVAPSGLLGQECSPDQYRASHSAASSRSTKGQHSKSSLAMQLFFNLPNSAPALQAQSLKCALRTPMKTIALCSPSVFLILPWPSFTAFISYTPPS